MNPPPNPHHPQQRLLRASGAQRLRSSLRRIGYAINQRAPGLLQSPDCHPDQPQPISEWGRDAEDRLCALEKKLSNQNRLLAFSLVAIIADVLAKVLTRSGP